jgi:hypothetical protein
MQVGVKEQRHALRVLLPGRSEEALYGSADVLLAHRGVFLTRAS